MYNKVKKFLSAAVVFVYQKVAPLFGKSMPDSGFTFESDFMSCPPTLGDPAEGRVNVQCAWLCQTKKRYKMVFWTENAVTLKGDARLVSEMK